MDGRERDKRLARLIFKDGLMERPPLEAVLAELKEAGKTGLDDVLVERGKISREDAERLSHSLNMESTEKSGWRQGANIGGYILRERIGKGSMGVVYRCRNEQTGAPYAMKALSKLAGSYLVSRFEREGQAQAQVDAHPNVVRIYSAGQEAGCLYLVMDLCTGGDLETKLRAGPLPERAGADLVMQLARGLAHVHARGVLHRDLKPANVLFDGNGIPKLVDFGLARVDEGETLTRTGDLIGTPTYMAPEQARGKHKAVDERADVYGLGAILYHVLTGRRPFVGASTIEVVHKVMASEPPKPTTLLPSLSPRLEEICLKAMAKLPDMRTPSATALADELEAFLAEGQSAERMPKGMKILIGVCALCLLLGGVGVGVAASRGEDDGGSTGVVQADDDEPDQPRTKRPEATLTDLRWSVPRGTVARCTITHDVDIQPLSGNPEQRKRRTYTSTTRVGWSWQVKRSSRDTLTIVATLDSLRVKRESMFGSHDFDSRAGDADSPYAKLVGGRVVFDVDCARGVISNMEGVEVLRDRLRAGLLTEGLHMRRLIYDMPQLTSNAHLENFLNTLFAVLPGQPQDLSRSWQREELVAPTSEQRAQGQGERRRWNSSRILGLPRPEEALVMSCEGDRQDGGRHLIRWKGKDEIRSVEGETTLADGFVERVELREQQTRSDRNGGKRRLKIKVGFELKGRR